MQEQGSRSFVNISGASPAGLNMISYGDNMNSDTSLHGKRDNQDGQMSPLSNFNKRTRLTLVGPNGLQQQQIGTHINWPSCIRNELEEFFIAEPSNGKRISLC